MSNIINFIDKYNSKVNKNPKFDEDGILFCNTLFNIVKQEEDDIRKNSGYHNFDRYRKCINCGIPEIDYVCGTIEERSVKCKGIKDD